MNDVLFNLKQQLKQINDLIIDPQDVLYFDYPLHLNVGDLLIYYGTEMFFRDYHINVRLRRCLQTFDIQEVKKYVRPNTTILCHGGGNFGDLYPAIQSLREMLVSHFPNNRIIVLPQTAHFSTQKAMEKSAAVFSAHSDCHFFSRDTNTFELMKKFSPNVLLCPDMAHQLYGSLPMRSEEQRKLIAQKSEKNKLYFLRKDIEKSQIEMEIQATLPNLDNVKDWDDILTSRDRQIEKLCSKVGKVANLLHFKWLKNKLNEFWYQYALNVINRCQIQFLARDEIITSRLHGHIFSCLLGIENKVCDNSYGKNSAYFNQWTKDIHYAEKY
ncbi:MAG: polysaccharide pyruvyl transferase family protein [Pasteurellaceae bacterium]|nr:polysaccharide pyruvyl transferase family protein [Pasteurellaceae bacterium]